jgi:hypothetical protein
MLDPIQSSGPERPQAVDIVGEERQADWKHPQSNHRQKPKKAAKCQQYPHWNPQPAARWLAQEANRCANALRKAIYKALEAPVIGAH